MAVGLVMIVIGIIAVLALIASIRIVLIQKYASQLRGQDVKEELKNVLAFAKRQPIVGWLLIGLWIMQYSLVAVLFVVLVFGINQGL